MRAVFQARGAGPVSAPSTLIRHRTVLLSADQFEGSHAYT
jgi:hypothetical protein